MEIHTIKFVYAGDVKERDTLVYLLDNILSDDDRYGSFFVEPKDMLDSLKEYFCDDLELDSDDYKYSDMLELALKAIDVSGIYDDVRPDEINSAIELLIKLHAEEASIKFYRE